jgi:glyoxylase-like metal-dependent hydrolase (beta-lactamase superfamily II)
MAKADSIEQVAPDLWFWQAYEEAVRSDLSSCAIGSKEGVVLVDPIELEESQVEALGCFGPVVAIVLTNGNHSRSAAQYRGRFEAPVFAHSDAVGALEIPVDEILKQGQVIGGDLEVICLPGGGSGEIVLYDRRGRLHFGDALVNLESVGFSILPAKYCEDRRLLEKSLKELWGLKVSLMTFAHGFPIVTDSEKRLRSILGEG